MKVRPTIIKSTTLALLVLVPFNSWALISSPMPGSTVAKGSTDELEIVGGYSVLEYPGVGIEIDAKTNGGTLLGETDAYLRAQVGNWAVFTEGSSSWSPPELGPTVAGTWPDDAGVFVHINAWWGEMNLGTTYVKTN